MYQSNRSLNIPPPPAYPGHLTSFAAREGGNLMNLVFPGEGHLITTYRGWGIWNFDFMLRVALIPRGAINHGEDKRRQAFMHSKRKIPDSWRTGWKAEACTSFVLYLKVFENHLHLSLACKSVVSRSIKPCLHTQLPEHNKSYRKVSWGWGHLITWNGPMRGIWTTFRPREGGIWTKIFQKFKWPGVARGGDVEASIWLVHNQQSRIQKLVPRNAETSVGALFQW